MSSNIACYKQAVPQEILACYCLPLVSSEVRLLALPPCFGYHGNVKLWRRVQRVLVSSITGGRSLNPDAINRQHHRRYCRRHGLLALLAAALGGLWRGEEIIFSILLIECSHGYTPVRVKTLLFSRLEALNTNMKCLAFAVKYKIARKNTASKSYGRFFSVVSRP